MDGWNAYLNKNVYIRLRQGREYKGKVTEIDSKAAPIIFITILDRFNKNVTFVSSEIKLIQEEKNG